MADPNYLRKNTEIIKGDELWLFIGTTSSTMPTAYSTSCSLNRSLSTTSISSKDHGTSSYVVPGEGSWTVSTEALMSINIGDQGAMDFDDLMEAFYNGAMVYVTFGKLSNYSAKGIVNVDVADGAQEWAIGTPKWEGQGYITSLQASAGHGDTATYSIEITGVGPLTRNPARQA